MTETKAFEVRRQEFERRELEVLREFSSLSRLDADGRARVYAKHKSLVDEYQDVLACYKEISR